jgi:hypothetical protein
MTANRKEFMRSEHPVMARQEPVGPTWAANESSRPEQTHANVGFPAIDLPQPFSV